MPDPVIYEWHAVRVCQAPDQPPVQPQFVGVRSVLILPCHVVPFGVRHTAGIMAIDDDALRVFPRSETLPPVTRRRKGDSRRQGAAIRRVMRREKELPDALFGAVKGAADVTEVKGAAVAINLDLVVTDPKPRLYTPSFFTTSQVGYLTCFSGSRETPLTPTALPRVAFKRKLRKPSNPLVGKT